MTRPRRPDRLAISATESDVGWHRRRYAARTGKAELISVARAQPVPGPQGRSWVRVRVLDEEALQPGRRIELEVGGDEGDWARARQQGWTGDRQRGGQLHGVITPKLVAF